jgi:uncharacterized membrane protein YoaK (UPF0700 family)
MFRHQGPARSERQNLALAGYLAFIGGFVNSAGFILIGSFTSHVTGNVGRLANDLVSWQLTAAGAAFTMIVSFYLGALMANLIIETSVFERVPTAYGVALLGEALLLGIFTLVASRAVFHHARMQDMEAALLCAAMGMQNSMVTRLSGAVVRTTHLTGVVTDLGIETARWLRWRRERGAAKAWQRDHGRIRLHLMIVSTFTVGAVLGSATGAWLHQLTMLLPCVAVTAGAGYAFSTARHGAVRVSNRPPASHHPPAPFN